MTTLNTSSDYKSQLKNEVLKLIKLKTNSSQYAKIAKVTQLISVVVSLISKARSELDRRLAKDISTDDLIDTVVELAQQLTDHLQTQGKISKELHAEISTHLQLTNDVSPLIAVSLDAIAGRLEWDTEDLPSCCVWRRSHKDD